MLLIILLCVSDVWAQVGAYSALAVLWPQLGQVLNVGDTYDLKWVPSSAIPTVDLVVKEGAQSNLATNHVVAANVPNTGSFRWTVPPSIKTSTSLTLMIHDSRDPSISNYSPYFTILEIGRGITKVVTSDAQSAAASASETILVKIKEHRRSTDIGFLDEVHLETKELETITLLENSVKASSVKESSAETTPTSSSASDSSTRSPSSRNGGTSTDPNVEGGGASQTADKSPISQGSLVLVSPFLFLTLITAALL